MVKNPKSWAVALIVLAVCAQCAAAEEIAGESDVLDELRSTMLSAAQRNDQLAQENQELKARLVDLQLEVEGLQQSIAQWDPEFIEARERTHEEMKPKLSPGGWNDPDEDALIREAQSIYLSGQTMLLDEGQRLREMQLYDLQYEKQERQLDLMSMQYLHQKIKDRQRTQVESLMEEIKASEAKLENVSLRIAEQEKAALSYPQRIELLKMENKALRQKIDQLQELLSR